MARLKEDPIGQATLLEYLETKSDFHFELKVLKMMRDLGLPCEHGGHYTDPVTKKSREFDIRCRAAAGPFQVQLAVECKNLQPHFPLLVTAVRRPAAESYHDVARVADPEEGTGLYGMRVPALPEPRARAQRIDGRRSMYAEGEPVGKSTTQVGMSAARDPEMVVGDSDVYEKWGQCLSSLADLVAEIEDMRNENSRSGRLVATALPVLVVPNGTLWRTIYADDGSRIEDPCLVERVSIWVGKEHDLGFNNPDNFIISHVEVMTEDGLANFIQTSLTSERAMQATFFARARRLNDMWADS